MNKDEIDFTKFSETTGVYLFRGSRKSVLYVGKAVCLRDRIRSYFSPRLSRDRGQRLTDMLEKAKSIDSIETDSVLDSLVLEANIIKKYQPPYNVREKSNKSFNFVCITDEGFPRVTTVRGREIAQGIIDGCRYVFGPFTQSSVLTEAMKIIRKLLPYRDTCKPKSNTECFAAQLKLCPGVCTGKITKSDYAKRIREIKMLFEGKKKQLIKELEKKVKQHSAKKQFEKAEEIQKKIFSLQHIHDTSLIKREFAEGGEKQFRTEAYDVAHLQGEHTVGVMVVSIDGELQPSQYRVFTIQKAQKRDDVQALKEILTRRFRHSEWQYPNLIVADGGVAQLNVAEKVCRQVGIQIPIVSVVKNRQHKPREILGKKSYAYTREEEILKTNAEAHRFALSRHRRKRKIIV